MKKTLPILAAVALMVGPQGAAAQQADGDWWKAGVLRISGDGVRYEAADNDGWWWEDDRDRRDEERRDEDVRYDRDDRRYESREGARQGRGAGARKGNGPPFCRSGEGHPVHGREWCARKGWGGGYGYDGRYDRYDDRWDRASWSDVILRGPQPTTDRRVRPPSVADILGDVVLGRLSEHGRERGYRGAVDGRWVPLGDRGSVLQLRMGGLPLAELADADRDGRSELVLLSRGR